MTSTLSPATGTAADARPTDHARLLGSLPPAQEAELIPLLRSQIDALDAGIARLVAERARLSRLVQTARVAAGGVRIELGRERGIVQQYRDSLGEGGVALGNAVLRVCRGPL